MLSELPLQAVVHRADTVYAWHMAQEALPFDETPGSPWLVVPPAVRAGFDALTAAGPAFAHTAFGAPMLGVKCGCNEAFIVVEEKSAGDMTLVRTSGRAVPLRTGQIERQVLRPLVRGENLTAWSIAVRESIVWTHGVPPAEDVPLSVLPRYAEHWLAPWRHRLAARSDTRGRGPWWALFRTEAAQPTGPRVIWSDFGRAPRATVLPAGDPTVPLNTCYVAQCPTLADAHGLAALLNGPLAAAWLNVVAEPARGGYRRYLGWTVALLPIPRQWERARSLLAPLSERALGGAKVTREDLRQASLAAYGVSRDTVASLFAWSES